MKSSAGKLLSFKKLDGIYISQKLAHNLKVKTGETLNFKILTANNNFKNLKAKVKGIYLSYTSQGLYTTFEYLNKNKSLKFPVQSLFIKTNNLTTVKKKLLANPQINNVIIKNKQISNYQKASKSVDSILAMIVLMSILLLFAVIYNISSINIFERQRDIAIEKALGLSNFAINKLILIENDILVGFSIIIGSILSPLVYKLLGNAIASNEMSFPAKINFMSIPISIVLILISLILTSLSLIRKVKRIDKLAVLKSKK
ncbi:FtsX-like permease family protein [Lactobacillus sp. DCY120]|uniref:FtsX-like permease family protein n=1 Tax=Bombilactobacillus apium TaxID=2675299 RepID=A0A850QZ44_9LACO|nr:FtsX-like permease family protein [Bombilactobacillus apium]NVY96029.1 FtsX-like permease family protein [Bombilactobacillus apium]